MANLSFWANAPDLGCSSAETAAWLAWLSGKQSGTPPYPSGYTAWASSLNGGPPYVPPTPPQPESSSICWLANAVAAFLPSVPVGSPQYIALSAWLASLSNPSSPNYQPGATNPYVPPTTWPSARDVWVQTSALPGAPYIPAGN
jgi:hypothetical protein